MTSRLQRIDDAVYARMTSVILSSKPHSGEVILSSDIQE
jgi:hypothetical protein